MKTKLVKRKVNTRRADGERETKDWRGRLEKQKGWEQVSREDIKNGSQGVGEGQ